MSDAVCRACLRAGSGRGVRPVRLRALLALYELLAGSPLQTGDGRPEGLCCACVGRLRGALRFRDMARRADRLLTHMLANNHIVTAATVASLDKEPSLSVTILESISITSYSETLKQEDVTVKMEGTDPKTDDIKHNTFTEYINMQSDLYCERCDATFASKQELVTHLSSHSEDLAPEIEQDPNQRETHCDLANEINTSQRESQCYECGKTFSNWKSLKIHSSIHTGAKPYVCQDCHKPFRYKQSLQHHVTVNHTRERTFSCDLCNKSFFLKKRLAAHTKSRHPETLGDPQQLFPCQPCDKTFRSNRTLQNHITVHHAREKRYACDTCNRSFFHKRNLAIHQKSYHDEASETDVTGFRCRWCDRTFAMKRHLTQHTRRAHLNEKPHCCDRCSKKFKELNQLKTHLRSHTGEQPYCCDTCGRKFSQRGNLLLHLKIHSGEKTFACEICGKTFLLKCQLTSHHQLHSGRKPHACDQCEMTFTYKSAWKEHVKRRHTEVKPFPCNRCGKSFDQENSLTRHLRIHTAARIYSCHVCSKSYTTAENLKRHLAIHSADAPYTCDGCQKVFKLVQYLNQHKLRCFGGAKPYRVARTVNDGPVTTSNPT